MFLFVVIGDSNDFCIKILIKLEVYNMHINIETNQHNSIDHFQFPIVIHIF